MLGLKDWGVGCWDDRSIPSMPQPTRPTNIPQSSHLGLLEARGAVLVHDRQPMGAGKIARVGLARVDEGADDPDAALALVVRLHGAGLWGGLSGVVVGYGGWWAGGDG